MSVSTSIYVVDHDSAARTSLVAAVASKGLDVRSFSTAEEFLATTDQDTNSLCVVADLRLPGISGLDLLEALQVRGVCFSAIIVSAFAETPLTVRALRLGAITVLDKPFVEHRLLESLEAALQQVHQRQQVHGQMEEIRRRLAGLTPQEDEILRMLMEGMPNKAMARRLNVSTRTIENRRRQLYQKMRTDSVPELVRMVVELNIRDGAESLSWTRGGSSPRGSR